MREVAGSLCSNIGSAPGSPESRLKGWNYARLHVAKRIGRRCPGSLTGESLDQCRSGRNADRYEGMRCRIDTVRPVVRLLHRGDLKEVRRSG